MKTSLYHKMTKPRSDLSPKAPIVNLTLNHHKIQVKYIPQGDPWTDQTQRVTGAMTHSTLGDPEECWREPHSALGVLEECWEEPKECCRVPEDAEIAARDAAGIQIGLMNLDLRHLIDNLRRRQFSFSSPM